jgi:hypothetical protein
MGRADSPAGVPLPDARPDTQGFGESPIGPPGALYIRDLPAPAPYEYTLADAPRAFVSWVQAAIGQPLEVWFACALAGRPGHLAR